jgi:hypothetical protein
MSDEAYSLVAALSALAAAVVLVLRIRQARITRRIIASLTPEQLEAIKRVARGPVEPSDDVKK